MRSIHQNDVATGKDRDDWMNFFGLNLFVLSVTRRRSSLRRAPLATYTRSQILDLPSSSLCSFSFYSMPFNSFEMLACC
jgi:hypothetical protein